MVIAILALPSFPPFPPDLTHDHTALFVLISNSIHTSTVIFCVLLEIDLRQNIAVFTLYHKWREPLIIWSIYKKSGLLGFTYSVHFLGFGAL